MSEGVKRKILVYPDYVNKIVNEYKKDNTIVSPKKINKDDVLKIHHRYINHEFGQLFKVEECFMTNDVTNYTVKFYNGRYATISMPLKEDMYEIVIDKDQKLLDKTVINEDKYYYGFRIKRWFFDRIHEKEYSTFIPYILYNGNNCLNDNRFYKIEAMYDEDLKIYTYFKFIVMSK